MMGRAVSTNIWLLLLEPPRLETCRKTTLAHPITAAKVVEIVTPCRSLRGAPPNCFERDALGRHMRSMPLMPRRGKTIIDGAHPEIYPCALRIIVIKRLVRLWHETDMSFPRAHVRW